MANPSEQKMEQKKMPCAHCQVQLTFPASSQFIECPKCSRTMSTIPNDQNSYLNCVQCKILLSHPPTSQTIQCPACKAIMELPSKPEFEIAHAAPSTTKKTKASKRKDPNAPKRASNAYMIFCKQKRPELKATFPQLTFHELGAKLGEIWREMPGEEKQKYEVEAAFDRERYKVELHEYQHTEKRHKVSADSEPPELLPVPNDIP